MEEVLKSVAHIWIMKGGISYIPMDYFVSSALIQLNTSSSGVRQNVEAHIQALIKP